MSTPAWREALAAYIAREARPVEKFSHQPRLYALTQQIAAGLETDDDVLCAACWLHDLGVFLGHRPEERDLLEKWDNVVYAIDRAPALLREFGFPEQKIPAVLVCIRDHQPNADPHTLESTVLRDADILEQLGAIGILRTVAKVGRDTRFLTFRDAVHSLERALATLPQRLRLPVSIHLAQPRIQVLQAFLASTHAESSDIL